MNAASAEEFLGLLPNDVGLALIACSPALRLADGLALRLIDRVVSAREAQPKGDSMRLLRRVKQLNCVRHQWDGTWAVAADVRPALVAHLEDKLNRRSVAELRAMAARDAEERLQNFVPDGEITDSNVLQTKFEVAFQRILVPETAASGATTLGELWHKGSETVRSVTAESVDYLAPEIEREVAHVPPEVSFLRGNAAKQRGDIDGQIRHFGAVWRQGRPGEIFGIAAHMFGLVIRDWRIAEQALRDSLAWDRSNYHQAVVLTSLGNLLAKNKDRWEEAEEAFNTALEHLELAKMDNATTWHSLGNLLAKWHRVRDAERCYRRALETNPPPQFRGEILASYAYLLSQRPQRYSEAIRLAQEALEFDIADPGPSYRVLAQVYERQGMLQEAIEAERALADNDRRLGRIGFVQKTEAWIRKLEHRLRERGKGED